RTLRAALYRASDRFEVCRGEGDLVLRPHTVRERRERGGVALAQHEGVVQVLLEGAQVDGVVVFVGDDEAEDVDVEAAAALKVGGEERRVRGADDVKWRGVHGVPLSR